uniref:Uncharacterized protein n=1 Tax=Amphimedon queenslandica TaxID=400682 RepID=A0A1X7UST0_AMPQE
MMNAFQCLVLVAAIGFIITTTVSGEVCYTDENCKDYNASTTQVCCTFEGIKSFKLYSAASCMKCKL